MKSGDIAFLSPRSQFPVYQFVIKLKREDSYNLKFSSPCIHIRAVYFYNTSSPLNRQLRTTEGAKAGVWALSSSRGRQQRTLPYMVKN